MAIQKDDYVIAMDWKGEQYLGMNLNWDYDKREVHISMLGYIAEVLIRFHHTAPKMPQDQLYPHIKAKYGAKVQYAEDQDASPLFGRDGKNFAKEVVGTFLYYT